MQGKIDVNGGLLLSRRGVERPVYCPRSPQPKPCCHHCALFGEPEYKNAAVADLEICEKTLHLTQFKDERAMGEDKEEKPRLIK